jgi:hypothetical protein
MKSAQDPKYAYGTPEGNDVGAAGHDKCRVCVTERTDFTISPDEVTDIDRKIH